jgi:hypothetical protein
VAAEKIIVKPGAKVITVESAQKALRWKGVVGLFSVAFGRACPLKEVRLLDFSEFGNTQAR